MYFDTEKYKVTAFIHSHFRLDGGAMFGSIPKNLWTKKIKPDEENCIPLVARSLLIENDNKKILVDCSLGTVWSEKEVAIFNIKNLPTQELPYSAEDITDIIITHLHFDHAGGLVYQDVDGNLKPTFPNALHHLQAENLANAKNPNIKEKASYRPSILEALSQVKLNLVTGNLEIFPDIFLNKIDGHTKGQQWLAILGNKQKIAFPSDLMPTAHHLSLPYCMGYDINSEKLLIEKQFFLDFVKQNKAEIIFQHDADTCSLKL